jgi:hypothetical protein
MGDRVEATSSRLVIRSTSGVSLHSVAARHGVGGAGCARPLARPRAARHHIRRDARVGAQPKWNDPFAEIAQPVGRRVEGACVGGSKPSLGTRQDLVSSVGSRAPVYEAGGRTFESCTRYQFISPIAQMAARLAVNQEVRGSKPRRGASSVFCKRALGCGRSSMEEPWAVNPLVPVRLRPVTPKRMHLTNQQKSGSSAEEQRPHKATAGGSCPPRTTKTQHNLDHQPPRRRLMKPNQEKDVSF